MQLTHGFLVQLVNGINTDEDGEPDKHISGFRPSGSYTLNERELETPEQIAAQLTQFLAVLRESGFPKERKNPSKLLDKIVETDKQGGRLEPSIQEMWWTTLIIWINPLFLENIEGGRVPSVEKFEESFFIDSPARTLTKNKRRILAERARAAVKHILRQESGRRRRKRNLTQKERFIRRAKGMSLQRYCQFMDETGQKPKDIWIAEGCPETYLDIYAANNEWLTRVSHERYRAKKRTSSATPRLKSRSTSTRINTARK